MIRITVTPSSQWIRIDPMDWGRDMGIYVTHGEVRYYLREKESGSLTLPNSDEVRDALDGFTSGIPSRIIPALIVLDRCARSIHDNDEVIG